MLVLVLAVIHDAAHGRLGVGRDFDQVEVLVLGDALCVGIRVNAELAAIDADKADLPGTNLTVIRDS